MKRPDLEQLAERIRTLREQRGLTQQDFDACAGFGHNYIQAVEKGRWRPSVTKLRQIARVLRTDYKELAILAGFLDPEEERPDGIALHVPEEMVDDVRSLLRLPPWAVRAVRRMVDTFIEERRYEEREPPPPKAENGYA